MAAVAVHPAHLERSGGGQLDLAGGVLDLDHRDDRAPGRDGLRAGRDRRQGALVTHEQVAVGIVVRPVAAGGAAELETVAHLCVEGPPPGVPDVAVGGDVEGELSAIGIPGPDRDPARERALLAREVADGLVVERHGIGSGVGEEEAVDVLVGVLAELEALEPRSPEHDAHQLGRQPLGRYDFSVHRSLLLVRDRWPHALGRN